MANLFERLQSEIEARQRMEGITPADLLALSPDLRRIIKTITRRKEMSLAEIVLELGMKPSEARELVDTLVEKGFLKAFEVRGELHYKTSFAPRREREMSLNVWDALSDKVE
jgi:DNA-binding MarR family transcriptional regulator